MAGPQVVEKATRRTKRVAELIRHKLGRIIASDLGDPRIGFITLTRVVVAADLRNAQVFVSVLGPESKQRTTLRGLNSARPRIQAELGQALALRRTPELSFQLDAEMERGLRISALLSQLARESAEADREPQPDRPDAGEPSEEEKTDGQ